MKSRIRNISLACLLVAAVFIAGCTSAGPYVTNVGYDGEGNLIITKNTVKLNWFFGTIHNGENEHSIVVKTPK